MDEKELKIVDMMLYGNAESKEYIISVWEKRKEAPSYIRLTSLFSHEQLTAFEEYEEYIKSIYLRMCAQIHLEDTRALSRMLADEEIKKLLQ